MQNDVLKCIVEYMAIIMPVGLILSLIFKPIKIFSRAVTKGELSIT